MAEPRPQRRRTLRAAQRLSWPERWLVLQAWLSLPLMLLALRCFGLARLWSTLSRRTCARTQPDTVHAQVLDRARRISDAVQRASWHSPLRVTCLTRSLVLWWLLGRHGIPSDLRIGVARNTTSFQAHAWVEVAGVVLNEDKDIGQRFAAFEGLPAALRTVRSPSKWFA